MKCSCSMAMLHIYAEMFDVFSRHLIYVMPFGKSITMTLNTEEEKFYLSNEEIDVKSPSESLFTSPSSASSDTSCGSLPHKAYLMYHEKEYAFDLVSHQKASLFRSSISSSSRKFIGYRHYIAIPGRRYFKIVSSHILKTSVFINRIEDCPYWQLDKTNVGVVNNEQADIRYFPSNMNKRGYIIFSVS